ncbi:MAG: enoyl-CoA hydratase-related protein, partial [Colwellia sp.]
MTSIKLEKIDKIIHLIFDKENSSVNLMDIAFADDLANAVDSILTQEFDGVIVRSAKSTFFVGGDIKLLYKTNDENIDQLSYMVDTMKSAMRQLETCGKPVISCING